MKSRTAEYPSRLALLVGSVLLCAVALLSGCAGMGMGRGSDTAGGGSDTYYGTTPQDYRGP